jgi:DNA-binding XRE family transcriptional regulator
MLSITRQVMPGFTGEVMARAGTAGTLTAVTVMNPPRAASRTVGQLLREWRQRRRLSQLDLAIQAEISARHLSFVETGRSRPTSDMIVRLSEHLDVPLRDRNALLLAGGYAPAYPSTAWTSPSWRQCAPPCARCLTARLSFPRSC